MLSTHKAAILNCIALNRAHSRSELLIHCTFDVAEQKAQYDSFLGAHAIMRCLKFNLLLWSQPRQAHVSVSTFLLSFSKISFAGQPW